MPLNLASTGGGSITLQADSTASAFTQTIPAVTGTNAPIVSGTSQASTSGTSITFTGIPSWAKRVTLLLNGVSLSGTAYLLVQVGSGSTTTTGYVGQYAYTGASTGAGNPTNGWGIQRGAAADIGSCTMTICLLSGNTYISAHSGGIFNGSGSFMTCGGGTVTLGGVLDRVVITTSNGTDTFDAGSINILYE